MRFIFFATYITIIQCSIDTWEDVHIVCPTQCVCQRSHLLDLSVARWSQDFRQVKSLEKSDADQNEVYNENSAKPDDHNPFLKFAMCMLQDQNNIKDFIDGLPTDVQALVLLYKGGTANYTILSSDLAVLPDLNILEIRGTYNRSLHFHFDEPLIKLQYVNFETIELIGSDESTTQKSINSIHPSELFDYVPESQRINYNVSIELKEEIEIVPYDVYVMEQKQSKMPSFYKWKQLKVIRIHNCKLDELHWEMFDDLINLQHLSLEHNEIKIVPPFAFYGALHIKTLSLAHNNILDLNYRALAGLLELEWLNLSDNNITKLSELTFPPFPKLETVDFRGNPIKYIFPMTFGIMNNTKEIYIGSLTSALNLQTTNTFQSLEELKILKMENVNGPLINQNTFMGLKNVERLSIQGNIERLEFDAFSAMLNIRELILKDCGIQEISMDTFYGLKKLEIVDLSMNKLTFLPPGLFEEQLIIKEIYLQNNQLSQLPNTFFDNRSIRLIRLTNNPWICTCAMTKWNQAITNRQRTTKKEIACNIDSTKTIKCSPKDQHYEYNYIFDNKLSPRCNGGPEIAQNRSVYYSIRKSLQCKKIDKISKHKMDKKLYLKQKLEDTIEKIHMQSKQLREMHTNSMIDNVKNIILKKIAKNSQRNLSPNYIKKYYTKNQGKINDINQNTLDNNIL